MSLNELLAKIKDSGGRITKTRTAILSYLLNINQPLSPGEIIENLKKEGLTVNKTTVYRELSFLTENNFVREIRLLGKTGLFELSLEHQHHLVCVKCHQIKTLAADHKLCQQESAINQGTDFKVLDHSLEFYGLCKKCQ